MTETSTISPSTPGTAAPATIRSSATRVLFRWLLHFHAAWLWLVRPLRGRYRRPPGSAASVLLTGTFFSENWIMNHLRPLAMSDACAHARVVSTFPIPDTPKVEWIAPPRWLCRFLGSTPARLLVFFIAAVREKPDVIGGFHLIPNGLAVAALAPLMGARSLHFCGGGPREVLGGGIMGNRALERLNAPDPMAEDRLIRAMSGIDHIICMGSRTARFYRDRGVVSTFDVIPGGIDGSRFECSGTEKTHDLVFVGRLVAVKRVDLFLDAVGLLTKILPNIRAAIVGSGELETELKAHAQRHGITANVDFAGHQANVVPWLQKSRVFVLTSDSEGLSLSMMEALACGLPCVVADVGELGEVIHDGKNGFLVAERTGAAFARVLAPLIADADALARLAVGAADSAASFGLDAAARKWDCILPVPPASNSSQRRHEIPNPRPP